MLSRAICTESLYGNATFDANDPRITIIKQRFSVSILRNRSSGDPGRRIGLSWLVGAADTGARYGTGGVLRVLMVAVDG